ncbi:TetR/AcrR family transcriptional regulator [Brevibacterium aurantiacum]|uniref:TetR/AcrR family transcriptional regulator n=1 Tax=Brevibacterium aurantiacum TaxID=273384 RepID=A0A4Z0KGC7_BREAU|nr:TetR/AcrR family transcriptional regulator [Brevibacterium aurantiacum]TGD37043.1 TetR/AcrR family transcriptional regulator [Brevibacterium aurantiacum]
MQPDKSAEARIDPRAARSAASLRHAILHLAERQPIADITVDQVVEAAGITRKTFYNHIGGPTELLTRTLMAELDQVRKRMDQGLVSGTEDLTALSRTRLGEIIDHILRRRPIYQQPDGRIHPQLYRMLSDHFYAAIRFSLEQSLREVPLTATASDTAIADIHASYIAHAYAGAIDTWLPHADTISPDILLDTIVGSLPRWMTTRK